MLLLLVIGISFIFYIKLLSPKRIPPWVSDLRKGLSFSLYSVAKTKTSPWCGSISQFLPRFFPMEQITPSARIEKSQENGQLSLLDLPGLALECILEKLPPSGLCSMAGVCSSLRVTCASDYFWDRHMKHKWGRVVGPAAYRKWHCFMASRRSCDDSEGFGAQGLMKFIRRVWPFLKFGSELVNTEAKRTSSLPVDSIMSWYIALETGKFWFPAQVYNRENGHVGFMLSCYDAEISYDSKTDSFQARYPPHGRRAVAMESGIQWDRLRSAPVDTSPHVLHISDCLDDLCPGDHIEIQWRRNKEFPYGWWYGVVGHLESCDGNENYCRCRSSDIVVLEFNQYTLGSRWRCATVNRKEHREEGNEADGFYGGVRKLYSSHEIDTWKRLWPLDILE